MPPAKNRKQRKAKSAPKISFEKRVLSVVSKKAETKLKVIKQLNNSNLIAGSGYALTSGHGYAVPHVMSTIALAQGTGNDERIGNKISNCKMRISGFVETLPYNPTTNISVVPYELHMVVLKTKSGQPLTNNFNDVKVYPNGVLGGIIDVASSCYPWNKDAYIIKKHKVFKLSASYPYMSGADPVNVIIGMDPKFYFQRFSVEVPVDKNQQYNDGQVIPNNTDCSILWYVLNGDNIGLNASQVRCQVSYSTYFSFQDL